MALQSYTSTVHRAKAGTMEVRQSEGSVIERPEPFPHDPAEKLQARNRELAAYAHTVAHDLKDPLSVILATSDAIFHITDLTPEELRAYLLQIQSTAHAMDDMIDNLLLLAELDDAHVPLEPLDMATIVSRIEMRQKYLVRQHRAQISLPKSWPAAIGYAPWVEEVWANFISNAIKYGGRPPRVALGAVARPDGSVLFWTRDNGAGVPPELRDRLFQPLARSSSARIRGHGLGLSIVRRIVEKLGGQVGVETEAGRGSQFFFTLPARK